MTWLAPWALGAGALGMLGVMAAHLLARQRPRALMLATARFLPEGMLEATAIQRVPTDRWWMLLRLAIVALLALGVAQPIRGGTRVARRTVLLLDRTLSVDAQLTARAALAPTDAVIAFDTIATLTPAHDTTTVVSREASLSGAMALLVRVRDSLARDADVLHVTLASPLASRTLDPATATLRALVPDSITLLSIAQPEVQLPTSGRITVRADGDDPIAATAILLGDSAAPAGSIVVRAVALSRDDSAAARGGATVVQWPARSTSAAPVLRGITVGRTTWVAPLDRDTLAAPRRTAQAIGWWADGTPAVWRERVGRGCIVQVRAALPQAGDQTLSLSAQAWLTALLGACTPPSARTSSAPAWLAAAPQTRVVSVTDETRRSALAPWLVGGALLLAGLELALRARSAT
jgi:Aerotolerance regulator N-terminal